jgi:hypothetical protein
MAYENELKITIESRVPETVTDTIESFCKKSGYSLIGKCSCKEDTIGHELKEKKRTIETSYEERVDCLHYGSVNDPGKKEGLLFVVESSNLLERKTTPNSKNNRKFKKGQAHIESFDFMSGQVDSVACYGYGDRFKSFDEKEEAMDFECQPDINFQEKLNLPYALKKLPLTVEEDLTLAEDLRYFLNPKVLGLFEGCFEPEELSKHLAVLDVSTIASLIFGRKASLDEANAIEEVTFAAIGCPKCWENDKKFSYISKGEIEIGDEEIPDD